MLKEKITNWMSKNYALVLLILIFAVILLFLYSLYSYLSFLKLKESVKPPESSESPTVYNPPAIQPLPENLKQGATGEVKVKDEITQKEVPLVTSDMPSVIFGTAGKIKEIKSDRLVVSGTGDNFADNISRLLNVIFTDGTITFGKSQANRYVGKEGLIHLKAGMEILIDSAENIRGKSEFNAKTINVIKE